ncbi:VWA domain-containing protein [Dyella sp.]|jgi:Ca-activated chloride channel family protein|uniref:VWA domain-containing protein n=1 Tax=Dyella sp. TaxID=1869338 RepID=UPI002D785345|nr:VWA domain-containing protein [Dyella sp.]HET6431582.1 VWA domain-containing protein [Dyella sp.]
MIAAVHAFHFLRPWWLLALCALPLALWSLSRADRGVRELARVVDAELLPHLLSGKAASRGASGVLLGLGWLLAALALAGPTWSRQPQPLYAERAAQVVAVSMSQRMLARDLAPSRLDRARYKARDLLAANQSGQNALIAFAGEAFVVAPLTSDAASLNELLDALSPDTMPTEGDNASQAIEKGVALISQAKAGGGSLVLITDRVDGAAAAAAQKARAQGVQVSVLGVGTRTGGPVPLGGGGFLRDARGNLELARRDDGALRAVATAGGGRFVAITANHDDIDALHAQLRGDGTSAAAGAADSQQWQDRGPWLLLPLLLVVALGFRRGWLMVLPLACLPLLPGTAHADGWQDLWQRPDQQAARALRQGDAATALKLAQDPALRGAAAYRRGDYARAERALAGLPGSDAQYNLGNALARQQRYKEAIGAYDRALARDPHNADALANKRAVEAWLRRQQQKKDAQNGDDSKDHQGKDGQQDGQNGQSSGQDKPPGQGQPKPGENGKNGSGKPGTASDKTSGDQTQREGEQGEPKDAGGKPQTAAQRAAEQARAEAAREALQKQMDQALAKNGRSTTDPANGPHQLGLPDSDDPTSRLPAQVRQALQRVPDDPGALLRRKFELEYRQRHGGVPAEDDQP